MTELFLHDERLGISLPTFLNDLDEFAQETQNSLLFKWEKIRGTIPDRIVELEKVINAKQAQLSEETDFEISCRLNDEIAQLASVINDLWIWFRTAGVTSNKALH